MENKDVISKRKANRVVLLLAVIFLASAVGLGGIYAWKSIKNTRSENSDDITHQSANAEAVLDENGMPEDGSDITETKIARDVTSLRELLLEDGKFAIELSEDIRITKGFNVNGTKKLVGDKTITMELYAEPFQSILKVQAGATLILDGITLDGNSNATGVEVEKKAGFTSLSGKILYPASYGVLSQGTTWIKDITIDRGVDSGLCVMTDSKAYVEGGEISGCSKAAIHVVIGGYVSISGDTKLTDSYMCINNRGTCEITDGVISDAWRTLIWNLGELTVDYEGKDKDDKLEWYNAGEFGIRSGENTKTYINGLYLHDMAKGGIKGIKHESMTVTNCKVENVGTYGVESANGKQDVFFTDIEVINAKNSGVRVYGANKIEVTNVTVTDTEGRGIQNGNATVIAKNVKIINSKLSGIYGGKDSTTEVEDAEILSSKRYGVENYAGTMTVKNVKITDAALSGVVSKEGTVTNLSNVTITKPVMRGIMNLGGTVTADTITIESPGQYGVTSTLTGEHAGELTVSNLTVKNVLTNNALNCHASVVTAKNVNISGAAGYGVRVTGGGTMTLTDISIKDCGMRGMGSSNDNSVLNVTNAEVDSTGMSGVVVGAGAIANLENITLKNSGLKAGKDTKYTASYRSALATTDGTINAKNVTISDSVGSGVYVNGGTLIAEKVVVNRAGENGAFFTSSSTNGEAVAKMKGVDIQSPKNRGIYNDGGTVELSDVKIINPENYGVTTALLAKTKYSGSVTIKGLNITGVKKSNALNCNASEMTVVDGSISDVAKYGAYVVNGGKMTITDTNIKDCGMRGMCSTGNDSILSVTNAEIENTGMSGIVVGSGAVANLENITLKNSGLTSGKDTTYTASYRSALSTSDGTINVKNVTIDDAVGSGVYVNGGTLTAENVVVNRAGENGAFFTSSGTNGEAVVKMNGVDIQTPKNRGVYNDGGTVELSNVKITDPATYGVTTALLTNTEYAGSVSITGLNISGVKKNNALNCNASEMTIVDGTISDVAGHGAYVLNGGKLTLNDVELSSIAERGVWSEAATAMLKNVEVHDAQYGVFVDGGTTTFDGGKVTEASAQGIYITSANKGLATADIKAVTIHEAGKRGVYNYGGNTTLSDVTITDPGEYGVSSGKADWTVGDDTTTFTGKVTATNLTVTGVKKNNALHCNASEMSVDGGKISDVAEHGAYVVSSGKLTLKNMEIHKTGIDGIRIESTETGKATANIEAVTIHDVVQRGVRNEGGDVTLTVVTITDPGTYGISSIKGDWKEDNTTYVGKVTATDLTVTGVKQNNALNCNASEIEVIGGTLSDIKEYGARVVTNGRLTLNNVAIAQCGLDAIGVKSGTVTVTGGTITGTTGYDVSLTETNGATNVTLTGVTITRAEGNTHGSMIVERLETNDKATTLTLDNCSLTGSGAVTTESAIAVNNGTLNIQNGGTYRNNVAGVSGGLINVAPTGIANIKGSKPEGETAAKYVVFENNGINYAGNKAVNGGVLRVEDGGSLIVDYCQFTGNYLSSSTYTSNHMGGVMALNGTASTPVTVTNSIFDGNRMTCPKGNAYGGAISVAGNCVLNISDCEFKNNSITDKNDTTGNDGGKDIRLAASTLNISGCMKAEIFSTNAAYTLNVVGALTEGSSVVLKWNTIKTTTTLYLTSLDIMNASKNYLSLHGDHANGYEIIYGDTTFKGVITKK